MQVDLNFEQQRLLNQPTNNERITNVRLRKQLQFLQQSKLKYKVEKISNNNIQQRNSPFDSSQIRSQSEEGDEISYRIVIEKGQLLQNELILLIPKHYPFQQPLFYYQQNKQPNDLNQSYQQSTAQPISELLVWMPKYKIMELVQLIAIKIKEKHQQESIVNKYALGKVIESMKSPQVIILIAILVRVLVGLGSYSGNGDWPNLGDFEAHRNWMSITVNKPVQSWYVEPEQNIWWRIDYPPIAAYLSYIFGSIYKHIQPQAMALQRGYQSLTLATFMRLSVLLVEMIFLFPAIYLLAQQSFSSQYTVIKKYTLLVLLSLLIKPDIILIDHGHFQYNSLILGLILSAFYCLLNRNYYICCILFTIAIHSKQMAVYYALAFFAGLIGRILNDYRMNKPKIIREIIKFGVIVLSVSLAIWLPFLITGSAHHVVQAIFPVHRGLYQLKVQNFWCISDVIMKWETHFSKELLMILCFAICTLLSILSMTAMILSSTKKTLTIGFYTIAMTFFMFSYHVHQKSILLPLAISPLLIPYFGPSFVFNLILSGTLGMYHLLKEDGQWLQYFVLLVFYTIFMESFTSISCQLGKFVLEPERSTTKVQKLHQQIFSSDQISFKFKLVKYSLYSIPILLHLAQLLITPPQRLEYLHHLLFAFYSFCFNAYSLIICNGVLVESLLERVRGVKREQKQF